MSREKSIIAAGKNRFIDENAYIQQLNVLLILELTTHLYKNLHRRFQRPPPLTKPLMMQRMNIPLNIAVLQFIDFEMVCTNKVKDTIHRAI